MAWQVITWTNANPVHKQATSHSTLGKSKSKSKSKKTLFKIGQCKQYNISSHLKWVLVADYGSSWEECRLH